MKNKKYIILIESLILILTVVSGIKSPEVSTWKIMIVLFIGTIVLLVVRKKYQQEQQNKERKNFFRRKYPMLASNVSLLLQSGMSPKSAFLYLAEQYGEKEDPLKQELESLKAKLVSGYGESLAYREFGEACMEKEYRRLMSLVTQYLEQGTRFLVVLLEIEMREANKARIRNARREGETLSTKMLLPMGLLLLDVVVIVIAPILSSVTALHNL